MLKLKDEILTRETSDQADRIIDMLVEHVIALEAEAMELKKIVVRVEGNQPHIISPMGR